MDGYSPNPDWDNATKVLDYPNNTAQTSVEYTYTATENGWVYGYFSGATGAGVIYLYHNDIAIYYVQGVPGVSQFSTPISMIINKGDTVKIKNFNASGAFSIEMYFVPHK